ncbi:GNAT family N-acetyltransferase [Geojedonia litorea]|uniref:GNAT family N-acetyltransferase n=1 Tax=Geojedonia litorea TaxID=1268269 RepID=A0ABV9N3I3_9FLAO
MSITEANISHLPELAPLFNAYRIFYKQPSNLEAAEQFLKERLQNKESIIYLAFVDNNAVGFTQLYPLFSSVSMKPMYLLNDLYVMSNYRGQGIGEALINKAKLLCMAKNYKGLALQTASDNPAQKLYERLGFTKDKDLFYNWTLE